MFGYILMVIYQILFLLSITSYLRGSLCNPGILRKNLEAPLQNYFPQQLIKKCKYCGLFKPPRAHHCYNCNKCIFRMDHHCEWLNNCVAIYNQKYFILFLFYSFQFCLITHIMVLVNAYLVFSIQRNNILLMLQFTIDKLLYFVIGIFSFFFVFMILSFFNEQIECIRDNQTSFESFKNKYGRPQRFMTSFKQIFGKNKWLWLIPSKPEISVNYLELLYSVEDLNQIQKRKTGYFENIFENEPYVNYKVL